MTMSDEKAREMRNSVLAFAIKVLVFFVVLVMALEILLPSVEDMNESVRKVLPDRNKLYLLGLVQNPAALYMTSEIAEKQGFPDSAKRDMELAVGLLELHTADKQVLKRYNDRLAALKRSTGR
jgi:hypothetical protein